MMPHDRIGQLAQQIGERLQNASQAPEDIQKGVQQVVRGAFDRLELVSREDFDILMDVLQRTRARVEALESQVAALEAALDNEEPDPSPTDTTASAAAVETGEELPDAAPEASARREGDDTDMGSIT